MSHGLQAAAADVIHRRLPFFLDPLDLHQANPARYPYFLESAAHGDNGRYDILFAFPREMLRLCGDGRLLLNDEPLAQTSFLAAFDARWRGESVPRSESALPFDGGWFLYLSYELVTQIESGLPGNPDADATVACAVRCPAAVVRDHATQSAWVVCERSRADDLLEPLIADALGCVPAETTETLSVAQRGEDPEQRFIEGVARVHAYIRAGDVFQVNLSRRWHITLARPVPAAALYRRLRRANPAPFAGLALLPDINVISSSPERLVQVQAGQVRTRPIAGTFPRSHDAREDAQRAHDLLRHPKERAEHIMLIDLERNDLGRICEIGSVHVPELMTTESYTYVHHIVSEVRGQLRAEVTPGEVVAAVFPGGTITGCPKVRCMEIIAELEGGPRGAYTGAMGFVNRDGSLDLNILIRTLTQRGADVTFRAGAGIVADSLPLRELEETRAKARGMLAALSDEHAA